MQTAARLVGHARALIDRLVPTQVRALGPDAVLQAYSLLGAFVLSGLAGVLFLIRAGSYPEAWLWMVALWFLALVIGPGVLLATGQLARASRLFLALLFALLFVSGIASLGRGASMVSWWTIPATALLLLDRREAIRWSVASGVFWIALIALSQTSWQSPLGSREMLAGQSARFGLSIVPLLFGYLLLVDTMRARAESVRDRAAAELRDSRALYQTLIDTTPDAILVAQADLIIYANAPAGMLWECPAQELVGRRALDLFTGPAKAARAELDATGRLAPQRAMALGRQKETPVEVRATYSTLNGRIATLIWVRDMTEEDATLAQLRLLGTAFEQSSDAILIIDSELVVRFANPAVRRAIGVGSDDPFVGLHFTEVFRAADELRSMREAFAGGAENDGVYTMRAPDGSVIQWRYQVTPFRTAPGEAPSMYLAIARDVTKEAELEERYREAARLEAVAKLAGGVAHEVNNQLQVILGRVELLRDQVDARALRDLASIESASQRAATVTRQLLAFARRAPLAIRVVDLEATVNEIPALMQGVLPDSITLEIEPARALPPVLADAAQFTQALLALVLSARESIEMRGSIRLETSFGPLPETLREPGDQPGRLYACLRVRDDGTRYPAELRRRAFQPFAATGNGGTGLELPSLIGALQQAGGRVHIESAPGIGTTVAIYLPVADEAHAPSSGAPEATPEAAAAPARVLLVDDEEGVRAVARRVLERAGYQVFEAANGADALALAESAAPDLVVTDLAMPGGSGIGLAEELASRTPDLPVLFITGYSEAAANYFVPMRTRSLLTKPFESRQLLARVQELLAARGR